MVMDPTRSLPHVSQATQWTQPTQLKFYRVYTGESRTRAALQSVQRIPICWAAELARNASTRGRATVWRSAVLRGTQPCGCMGPVSLPVPALEGSVELALGDAAGELALRELGQDGVDHALELELQSLVAFRQRRLRLPPEGRRAEPCIGGDSGKRCRRCGRQMWDPEL